MKNNNRYSHLLSRVCSLFFLLSSCIVLAHGFDGDTLVRTGGGTGFWSIKQTVMFNGDGKKQYVASYDIDSSQWVKKRVTSSGISEANCYCKLSFDEYPTHDIYCTPTQYFYRVSDGQWIAAYKLKVGDIVLCENNNQVVITSVALINEPLIVYSIQVEDVHTFFVGAKAILTHNMIMPVVSTVLSVPLSMGCGGGSLGVALGPVGAIGGMVVGGIVGYIVSICIKNKVKKYRAVFDIHAIQANLEYNKAASEDKNNEAQAPGKPTEDDGFVPKKNWDGKKVRHPKTGQVGWPDNKGSVWVPTGPNGHGGPHWDVVKPNGIDYDNVYPGGKIRKGNN